jgi:hypothetical protein
MLVVTVGIEVRQIRLEVDIPALDAHYVACGLRAPGAVRSRDEYLLAWDGDELVGSAMFWIYTAENARGTHWEDRFGLHHASNSVSCMSGPHIRAEASVGCFSCVLSPIGRRQRKWTT